MLLRLSLAATLVALAPTARAAELSTVAVASFTTDAASPSWIGIALADALDHRLAARADLGSFTARQLAAAMYQLELQPERLGKTSAALELGRHLGTRYLVVGTYRVTHERCRGEAKVVDVVQGRIVAKTPFDAPLTSLATIEESLALTIAKIVGGELKTATPQTRLAASIAVAQDVTEALVVLRQQSLAPRAADPVAPVALSNAQLEKAEALLRRAAQALPTNADVAAGLALITGLRGDTQGASRLLSTAVPEGRSGEAALVEAFTHMRAGRMDVAEQVLRRTVGAQPGFLHARGSLAQLLVHLGRLREARAAYQQYLDVAPRQPWVLAQVGYCEAKLGKKEEAIAVTRQAVAIVPTSPYLLTELAGRQIDADDLAGAQETLKRVLSHSPRDLLAHVRLGYVQLLRGEDAASIRTSEKALKLAQGARDHRERAYAHLNLARAYGHAGKIDLALDHLTQARDAADISLDEVHFDPALAALRQDPRYIELVR